MPFSNLNPDDVAYIDVTFGGYPPYRIQEEDQIRLVAHLKQVKVSKKTIDYFQYDGVVLQMFKITLTNGTPIGISASSPVFVIDGIGYQCDDYDTCQAIYRIYATYIETIRQESTPTTMQETYLLP